MMHSLVVDRAGLARKLAHRPKAFIIYELLQNAWDEPCTHVHVQAKVLPGRPACSIVVTDDNPEGFADLKSIYTMFRDSKKAADPTKRGRFELGEKLVIALAQSAHIVTTKGSVKIEGDKRYHSSQCTASGTEFSGTFKITREEFEEMVAGVRMVAPPAHIETTFNGELLDQRPILYTFSCSLATVRADEEGVLRPTQRRTDVHVYPVRPGETAHIFEMGIPVVETGDAWHYDVQQRVPVNWERNNVPPAYLRSLRVAVLSEMHDRLPEAKAPWVDDALSDPRCELPAVETVVRARFGDKAVIVDPSDPEGTKIAMSQGYTVVPGGAFSKEQWNNVRAAGALLPAGQVTPSPKPYGQDGRPEQVIPVEQWSTDMQRIVTFAQAIFSKLTQSQVRIYIVNEPKAKWEACFDAVGSEMVLNYGLLGEEWFRRPVRDVKVLDLLLHEYVHHTVDDHLSHAMHEEATRLGACLVNIALDLPELFRD